MIFFALLVPAPVNAQQHHHGAPGAATQAPAAPPRRRDEARVPVTVAPAQQANMGLRTAKAERASISYTIRTVGTVTADETTEAHVHTRINGWIDQLFVTRVGDPVKKGQPLYALYSPDLLATQEEFLSARRAGGPGAQIAAAALERLRLWSVPESEIARLKRERKARRSVTFASPVDGYVISKTALLGMYVTPDMELYYLADLRKLWIIVRLYESDLSIVKVGDDAHITLPYDPQAALHGTVSFIYPEVDPETRTGRARVEVVNAAMKLKPGMYANVEVRRDLGEQVVVPDDAVLDTGVRRLVFVQTAPDRFTPREVVPGPRIENRVVIRSGLNEGESVVTGALFLLDAESKLQAVLRQGGQAPAGHGEHGGD